MWVSEYLNRLLDFLREYRPAGSEGKNKSSRYFLRIDVIFFFNSQALRAYGHNKYLVIPLSQMSANLRGLLGVGVVAGANGFDYLRGIAFTLEILLAHSFLDAIDFVLIPFPVTHCTLLSLFQG